MVQLFSIWILLIIFGLPVAFSLGVTSLLYLWMNNIQLYVIAQKMVSGIDSFILLAVPMYMLAGKLMNQGGMTKRIFRFAQVVVGRFPGGLGHVNVLASMIFAGMSGSALADIGGLGTVELEAMEKAGYKKDFRVAITAASSTIGPIIPPSIPFIIYSMLTNVSVGALFAAGFIPGVLMGIILMITIFIMARKQTFPIEPKKTFTEFIKITWEAFLSLITPGIILGGIFLGIFTPTEGAVIAVFYSLFIGLFVYREIKIRDIPKILLETIEETTIILIIVSISSLFGWIIAREQVPQMLASYMIQFSSSPVITLLILNLLFLIVGCFLDPMPAQIILVPFLLPLIKKIGIDPIHFGVIIVLNLMIGILTPPFGTGLFMISKIGNISVERAARALLPFIVALIIALLIVTYVPKISLFLPYLIFYK